MRFTYFFLIFFLWIYFFNTKFRMHALRNTVERIFLPVLLVGVVSVLCYGS